VLTVLDEDDRVFGVFLPKRHGDEMEDSDLHDMNSRRLQYYLTYRGQRSVSRALLVDIE
jgi:hypothetical protein